MPRRVRSSASCSSETGSSGRKERSQRVRISTPKVYRATLASLPTAFDISPALPRASSRPKAALLRPQWRAPYLWSTVDAMPAAIPSRALARGTLVLPNHFLPPGNAQEPPCRMTSIPSASPPSRASPRPSPSTSLPGPTSCKARSPRRFHTRSSPRLPSTSHRRDFSRSFRSRLSPRLRWPSLFSPSLPTPPGMSIMLLTRLPRNPSPRPPVPTPTPGCTPRLSFPSPTPSAGSSSPSPTTPSTSSRTASSSPASPASPLVAASTSRPSSPCRHRP